MPLVIPRGAHSRRGFLATALLLASLATLSAETVTLSPVADTALFENDPDNNLGAAWLASGTTAALQQSRALIRFDVTSVPAQATITSVRLSVSVTKEPLGAVDSTYALHRVLQSWGEGTKGSSFQPRGAAASSGEATWNARFFPSTLWGSPGAAAGTDYTSASSASQFINGFGSFTFGSTAGLIADIQAWISSPASNFGWIMISQSEGSARSAKRFGSRETGSAATLTIDYTLPGPTTQTLTVMKSGGGSGLVTSDPPGIDCGATCSANFSAGTGVTLTASAGPNSVFGGWMGDGSGSGNTRTVTLDAARSVTAIFTAANQAPVANAQSVTTAEEANAAITLTGSDPEGSPLTYTIVSGPARGSLLGSPPQITYQPDPNFNGSDSFTFKVNDGSSDSAPATVSITVTPVNDPPVASSQSVATSEDTDLAITLSATDIDNSNLNFFIASGPSRGSLLGAAPNVVYRPDPNFNGSDSFTFQAHDGSAGSAPATISITVSSVNDPPTLSDIPDQVIDEDSATQALSVVIDDVDSPLASLTLEAASSNTALVPNANITLDGSDANRTVTVTPAANQSGSTTITLTARDSSAAASKSFILSVRALNDPPALSAIADMVLTINSGSGPVGLTVSDVESTADLLELSAASSDPALIPPANIVFSGADSNRAVTITPAANRIGQATLTVTLTDPDGATAQRSLTVTVACPASAPALAGFSDQTIAEDSVPGPMAFTIDPDSAGLDPAIRAESSNPALIPDQNFQITGTGANWTLGLQPAINRFGSAVITVTLTRGGPCTNSTASRTFSLIVNPVNDPPVMSPIADQTINANASTGPLAFAIDDVDTPVGQLLLGAESSNTNLVPTANIVFQGEGTNRIVTITPVRNQGGETTISLSASDGDLSVTNSLNLTVNPPECPVSISQIPDQAFDEDSPGISIPFQIAAECDPAGASVLFQLQSTNPSLLSSLLVGGTGTNRTLEAEPAANQFGSTRITVTALDGPRSASTSFLLTLNSVNDPPVMSPIADQTINANASTGPLAFAIDDVDTPLSQLLLGAESSNTNLVPTANIVFQGEGTNRTVTITPGPNQSGATTIGLVLSDGDLSVTNRFQLTVTALPCEIAVATLADVAIDEDTAGGPIPVRFTANCDPEGTNVLISAQSSDLILVPAENLLLGGAGSNRTLTIIPATNQFGTATITLTFADGTVFTTAAFQLIIRPVNDAPFATDDSIVTPANTPADIAVLANDGDFDNDPLTVSSVTQPPNGMVSIQTNQTVRFTPQLDFAGTNTFSYVISDGQGASSTGLVTVIVQPAPVSTPPSFQAPVRRADGVIQLSLMVNPGGIYVIEASTNLSDWIPLSTNTAASATLEFTDLEAPNLLRRFYRAREP